MSSTKESVTHVLDPTAASHTPLFLPRIGVSGGGVEDEDIARPFQNAGDIARVMDYPHMPDPPPDCLVMHCEAPGSGIADDEEEEVYDGGIVFPKRAAKLSGGYIFLSRPKDGNESDNNSVGGKIVCIPLRGCEVGFPPGGRRVFREHAHTGARRGYEMAIHVRHDDEKMTCYIVLDSLGQRETWAGAINLRCDVGNKITILRPGGIAGMFLLFGG